MKNIVIPLPDTIHDVLTEAKGTRTWRDYLLSEKLRQLSKGIPTTEEMNALREALGLSYKPVEPEKIIMPSRTLNEEERYLIRLLEETLSSWYPVNGYSYIQLRDWVLSHYERVECPCVKASGKKRKTMGLKCFECRRYYRATAEGHSDYCGVCNGKGWILKGKVETNQ